MRKSFQILLMATIVFCLIWTAAYSEESLQIQLSFDEAFEFVAPYEGIGIEEMSIFVEGTIPYRGSGSIISEKGEYTVGKIGNYWGPVKVLWRTTDFFPPLPKQLIIGMSKDEVISTLLNSVESDNTGIILDNAASIEQIFLTAEGVHKDTPLCLVVSLGFENDNLWYVELTIKEKIFMDASARNTRNSSLCR